MEPVLTTWVPLLVSFAAASVGAVTDVLHFRVRNYLTIPLIVTGLIYHTVIGGWTGLWTSGLGFAFGLGIVLVPWLLGLMGAGDVKLLAGVGSWLRMPNILFAFVVAAAVTFVYAVVLIVYRGKFRESLLTIEVILYRFIAIGTHFGKDDLVEECYSGPERRLRVIPFGAAVPIGIIGATVWLLWTHGFL